MVKDALEQGPVWALGAMSGTSLDGVDGALIRTDGRRIFDFGPSGYRQYTIAERAVLMAAMGRWDGLEAAAAIVERAHIMVLEGMQGADLVGFHGQTTTHDPRGRGTCQIGNGQKLANALDLPVVWDFRSADVRLGGQGAPLAPFFHHACAVWAGLDRPVAFLNLGGVGNLTWVDPAVERPDAAGACLAFDTGPANAPINDLMEARLGRSFDEDGAVAARGDADGAILDRLADTLYISRIPPKSLDRNDFKWLEDAVATSGTEDAAATLTACAAAAVAVGMVHCPTPPARMLVTGGGRKNPVLMAMLAEGLDCPVDPVEAVGLDGDMLEAQAFGYLAVRVAQGWPTSAPSTTGVAAAVGGGTLSRPGR